MANNVQFEGKERRMAKIEACLNEYGIASLEDARDLCLSKGIDVESIVKGVQPIAFENAVWAYTLGVALAIKSGVTAASEAALNCRRAESVKDSFDFGFQSRLHECETNTSKG